MVVFWVFCFILLLLVEIFTVNLVSIWFAIGALIAFGSTFITDNVIVQTVVFIVVSIIALIITKPIVKKLKLNDNEGTNLEGIINKTGLVTKDITKHSSGYIKILGSVWTAISDDEFKVGDEAVVLKIEGVKLVVKKKEEKK